jgi:hypothetical protein
MKNLEKSLAVCWEEPPKISLFFDISSGFFREIVESSLIILVARVYKNQLNTISYPSVLVLRTKISGNLDEGGEMGHLRHQIGGEVHNLLEEELTLLVNL